MKLRQSFAMLAAAAAVFATFGLSANSASATVGCKRTDSGSHTRSACERRTAVETRKYHRKARTSERRAKRATAPERRLFSRERTRPAAKRDTRKRRSLFRDMKPMPAAGIKKCGLDGKGFDYSYGFGHFNLNSRKASNDCSNVGGDNDGRDCGCGH